MVDLTGYRLTFDDEFNTRSISLTGSGTTWASTRQEWRADGHSDIGFGRSSFVDPSSGYDPFNVSNGVLSITAAPDRTPYGYPGSWESGLITTQGNFSQTYGYFEVRADFSNAAGAWDAFWLLPNVQIPDPNNLGRWQELDVVEHYGVWDKGIYSGIHTTDPAPNEHWQQFLQVYSELPSPSGYHTYGMNWQADRISFYIDGQLVGSQATPSDMHAPMYLVLDLATQEPADIAGVPITSKIDYVRVYSANPNAQAVTLGTVSSPDGYDPGMYGAVAAGGAPPSQPGPSAVTIGSGSDKLVLKLSQDAYLGDALFTVSVDGVQIGGTMTAHAAHSSGQSDTVTVLGDWAAGTHNVFVHLLNDRWDGTASTDRNLYLDSATYNGVQVPGGALGSLVGQSFSFQDSTTAPPTTPPPPTAPDPTGTIIGSGSDTLVLKLSQDAYLGDAMFTVSVDGVQIGGALTAHAAHSSGQSDTVTVLGDWATGTHNVFVHLLNDRWDGTASTDRNLYLDSASYNGAVVPGGALGNLVGQSFVFQDTTTASPGTAPPTTVPPATSDPAGTVIGSGLDKLVLKLSQDAYLGDALYTVSVDGVQIGGTLTATAAHATGQSDTVSVLGSWGTGAHSVFIHFLNDRWDGTPSTDRNLYLDSASYNGAAVPEGTLGNLLGQSFTFYDHLV